MSVLRNVLLFVALSIAMLFPAYSLNLQITDPRNTFSRYPGTIEDMRMTVKAHGSFFELGLYLTVSPKGSPYSSEKDTLEAILDFELNEKAFINDMWLFLNDTVLIKARLLDKWTAGFIYEGIVKRRLDPAILSKTDAGKYSIRIFPLIGNSTRTVKMNIYLPCQWNETSVSSIIPVGLLKASHQKPQQIKIYAYSDSLFHSPSLTEKPEIRFDSIYNARYGNCQLAIVPTAESQKDMKMEFSIKPSDGIFANYLFGNNENFYQIVINPINFLSFLKPKRLAIMVDFDQSKTYYSKIAVFNELKSALKESLISSDSFNLFISCSNQVLKATSRWIPGDSLNINYVFNSLNPDTLSNSTMLPSLLETGVKWANENADTAIILILSCSGKHGSQAAGNELGNKVLAWNHKKFVINACSFHQRDWEVYSINGQNWASNNYLYNALCSQTRGLFNKIPESGSTVYQILTKTLKAQIGGYNKLSLSSFFYEGYAYDKVNFENNSSDIDVSKILIEFGKFKGKLPSSIELTGYYRGTPFLKSHFMMGDAFKNQYDNRSMWAGITLRNLELDRNKGTVTMWDIVNRSMEYKVLSLFTAFLATEDDIIDTIPKDVDEIVPVEMMFFDAKARDAGIDLFWATASEENNMGFYLDRKLFGDENHWKTLGFIEGSINSKTVRNYEFFDGEVEANSIYQYRLRQIDLDGTIDQYSKILTVAYQSELALKLENSPNPMRESTTFRFTVPIRSHVLLEIYDMMGNNICKLLDSELAANAYEINWHGTNSEKNSIPSGIYLCRLTVGSESLVTKVIISR